MKRGVRDASGPSGPSVAGAGKRARSRGSQFGLLMEHLSSVVTRAAGTTGALFSAIALILAWLACGPIFHFSDTWQLVINTTTTIVTFLMVFLIQRAQNKDARAMSAKLNELIAALEGASNRLIDVESLSEAELDALHRHFQRLAQLAKQDSSITNSHSVEEADERHRLKKPRGVRRSQQKAG